MKKIIICFICLFPLNVQSKLVLSGYLSDQSEYPVYYEDTSIVSYGKVVSGQIQTKRKNDSNQTINREADFLYFCKFDELKIVKNKLTYLDSEENFVSRDNSESSQDTSPITMTSSGDIDKLFGFAGFRNKLKSNCSKVSKSLPRYEIPIVRSESVIYHVLLDTIKNQGNLKVVWTKKRDIVGETIKDEDGKPLLIDNQEFKNYQLDKEGKYKMVEFTADCKQQKLQVTKNIQYDSKGSVIDSFNIPYDIKNDNELIPNTVGEIIHQFVCSF